MHTRGTCHQKERKRPHRIDVEIKTRTEGTHFSLTALKPRPDFFIACRYDGTQETWIFPSTDFVKHPLYIKKLDRHTLALSEKKEEVHAFHKAFYLLKLPTGGKTAVPLSKAAPKAGRVSGSRVQSRTVV